MVDLRKYLLLPRVALVLITVGLMSCGPRVKTVLVDRPNEPYALDPAKSIAVLGVSEPAPVGALKLGTLKIGDSGFSTSCGWERVLDEARGAASKAGGNLVKITSHDPPGFASSCHRISAEILRVDSGMIANVSKSRLVPVDTTWEYAMLYIYRPGGLGPLVSYNLHLGDSLICRVVNKSTFELKLNQEQSTTLWARTESRSEVPLDIRFGHTYYLRCTVGMGAFVGHPKLELVDPLTGKIEYEGVLNKRKKK